MRDEKEINIIILDDVADNLVILAKVVGDLGYSARPVLTIRQAITAIERKRPTLMLLDIAMPEMSGFDFYRMIKGRYGAIPAIFVSAYVDIQTKMDAYAVGAADYVSRPFNNQELACRIKRQVENIFAIEENKKQVTDLKQLLSYRMHLRDQDKRKVVHAFSYMLKEKEVVPGRMERVSRNSVSIAKAMRFMAEYEEEVTDRFLEALEITAPLYDFGMLAKETEIKQHTTKGIEPMVLLYKEDEDNEYMRMAVEIATYHHERFDGAGYPFGVAGDAIPLSARIVAVTSVFEEIECGDREEMKQLINNQSGSRFDPGVICAFNVVCEANQLDKD